MDTGTATAEVAPSPTDVSLRPPGPLSVFQVLFSPGEVFARIAQNPRVLASLLLTVATSVLLWGFIVWRVGDFSPMARKQLESNSFVKSHLTEAQIEQQIAASKKMLPFQFIGGSLVAPPITYLVIALVYWVLFKVLFGSAWSFKAALSAVIHAGAPSLVGLAAMATITLASAQGPDLLMDSLARQESPLKSSVGSFVSKDAVGSFVHQILTSLDVFSAWVFVLAALGFAAAARTSKAKAAAVVGVAWGTMILAKAMIFGIALKGLFGA